MNAPTEREKGLTMVSLLTNSRRRFRPDIYFPSKQLHWYGLDEGDLTFKGPMTTLVVTESNRQWPND
jgi:hypothetical protein